MEPIEYERMDAAEERLWWYRALHAQLLDALGRSPLPAGAAILDAGCGTGGLLKRLAAIAPGRPRVGLDREATAAHRAACKSDASIVIGSVDALPFADASFGADMLYHRDVDPSRAASDAYRCLMPEGMIVVNRPAFGWLASYHDRQVHGARRYDPRTGACAAGTGRRPRAQTARVAAVLADQCSVRRGHADRTPRDEMGAALSGRRLGRRGGATMSAPAVLPARVGLSFVVPVSAGDLDVVYSRHAVKQHAAWRNLGSGFANRVADWLLDKPRGLYVSSFRCMSRFVVDNVIRYTGPFPYMDGFVLQVAGRIDSIEVKPLRIASGVGLVFMVLGLIGTVAVVAEGLLGILGEYLGKLVRVINGKPQAVVREFVGPATPPEQPT